MVNFKIVSTRGDHQATLEPADAKILLEKLSGKRVGALPESFKTKVPDTFAELEKLWVDGKMGYMPFLQDAQGEFEIAPAIIPDTANLYLMAPVVGG